MRPSALVPEGRSMAQEEKLESVSLLPSSQREHRDGRRDLPSRRMGTRRSAYSYGVSLLFDGQLLLPFVGLIEGGGETYKMYEVNSSRM